ncbi:membrane protein insertion efficiency factor YidD [Tolypothrix sp. PCC 7910]|uniref:membrane protein insertion efficiency factor YidD n=1 Tax=Tolypothrix sp. PCC 7910 TaxID=2099387 RepID=UPI0014277EBA|nr:membrane protein insertion efficiency factor YidD [Tolypothrix sp. PCC 7910]QIR37844.1 membrane protein insertion efficiency factor YidD [Tolypothrix sp. PCC 7910]
MEISPLDLLGRKLSVVAITGYQKHISPRKGFVCAHRVLYGGESCSQYIKRVIAEDGFAALPAKSHQRFQACKEANRILRSQAEESEPIPEGDEQEEKSPKALPGRKAQQSSSTNNTCGDTSDCGNITDASCDCAELLNMTPDCSPPDCSTPDCSAADCNSLDCGSLDCSAADCGSLDCGSCGS